jgi:hypothetical protein
MAKDVTLEKFWEIYEKLPQDLQEAVFSFKIVNSIGDICDKNKIEEDSKLNEIVSDVLLGILPLENFQKTLEKELKLKKEVAEKVSQEVNNLIFAPVKESLAKIYGKEIPVEEEKTIVSEKPSYPKGQDIYREPIE